MTFEEVEELFIRAAHIQRKMDMPIGPSRGGTWRYYHDAEDIADWSKADRDRLANTGDYGDARRSREAISLWERSLDLIELVSTEENRRCLLSWALARAGGPTFLSFCRSENICEMTGSRRKKRAITEILSKDKSLATDDSEKLGIYVLPNTPEMGHKSTTMATDANKRGGAWKDKDTEAKRDSILADWADNRSFKVRRGMLVR